MPVPGDPPDSGTPPRRKRRRRTASSFAYSLGGRFVKGGGVRGGERLPAGATAVAGECLCVVTATGNRRRKFYQTSPLG